MKGEIVRFPPNGFRLKLSSGSTGLMTHVPGAMASVSNLAEATGGIKPGNLAQRDTK